MTRTLLLVIVLGLLSCRRPAAPAPSPHVAAPPRAGVAQGLQIPRANRPPVLAQHDDDPLWQQAVTTGPWLQPDTQSPARPYSQARLLWDAHALYLSLYAADQNIEAFGARHDEPLWPHDSFAVRIQADLPDAPTFAVDLAPTGTVTDLRLSNSQPDSAWESGALVSMDMDGTLNNAGGEDDEEWVAFVALPWQPMRIVPVPGLRVRLQFKRCDVPKDGVKRCGEWAQTVVLAGSARP